METEGKNVDKTLLAVIAAIWPDSHKEAAEGPVSIETIAEESSSFGTSWMPTIASDESSFGTRVSVDDKPVEKSRPALERVSYSHLSPGLEQSGASWMPRSSEEKEAPREEAEKPFSASEGNLCRCGKDHGPSLANMLIAVFGNAQNKFEVSNARATKDGAVPVSERFGRFGKSESSGDTEKLGPEGEEEEEEEEEKKPWYPNVEHFNLKYGFHKEEEDEDKSETLCVSCGKVHPAHLRMRSFILRRETPAKEDDKVADKDEKVTEKEEEDSTPSSRSTKFLTYDEISDILGRKGHLTDKERGAHIRWKRFRMEQERRISVALKDMKRAATCKGPEQTFEIITMLAETKRYVKKDDEDDEPEYFPQWIYYALKDLISTAKNLVVTKNKYELSRLARRIESVHPYPPKDDKAAIKILKYAKGAVIIIAGEMALSFISSK